MPLYDRLLQASRTLQWVVRGYYALGFPADFFVLTFLLSDSFAAFCFLLLQINKVGLVVGKVVSVVLVVFLLHLGSEVLIDV
jgi:hypothetical protein